MTTKKTKKASAKKKPQPSNAKVFFKYLLIFAIMLAVSVFLFLNRHKINETVSQKVSIAKEKVTSVKSTKSKPSAGYKKDDRRKLEQLISEETKPVKK